MADALPKKKLPFKPTALRKKAAAAPKPTSAQDGEKTPDDDLDLFRQSKMMAPILAAQQEKNLRRKQKHLEERQRRRSIAEGKRPMEAHPIEKAATLVDLDTPSPGELAAPEKEPEELPAEESMTVVGDSFMELVTPPPSKRSRHGSGQGSRSSKRQRPGVNITNDPFDESPSKRSLRSQQSPAKFTTPSKKPKHETVTPGGAPLIELDSDSEEDVKPVLMATSPSQQRDDSVGPVDPATPEPPATQPEEDDEFAAEYIRKDAAEIMVTSSVPNAQVAYMKYQFDRPLRLVRDSWIALQRRKGVQLPITQDDDIILTWQRRKVYTLSTLLNLGIRPQADGKITADDYRKGEAWTTELFKEMELEEERRQKREMGELSSEESEEEEPATEQVRMRVRLLARGMKEVGLQVVMETTVETLVNGFRRERNIPSDRDVGIYFDGDRLEEHDTMESVGIDDMDSLEVHIK
ncbi:hypothetical protein PT974_08868 [Cladobotryum mycophilum]|uniref:Ubiquitin-like domain-containing protein n=1 Tax=Cladobotryum mycophilum TaxID=491253 RepID=A0ABR0SEN5_9HYPO